MMASLLPLPVIGTRIRLEIGSNYAFSRKNSKFMRGRIVAKCVAIIAPLLLNARVFAREKGLCCLQILFLGERWIELLRIHAMLLPMGFQLFVVGKV